MKKQRWRLTKWKWAKCLSCNCSILTYVDNKKPICCECYPTLFEGDCENGKENIVNS